MKKVYIFTKEECPNCAGLEMFLKFATKGAYNKHIEYVRMEEDTDKWKEFDSKLNITSVPTLALVDSKGDIQEVVRGYIPPKVKSLFENNF